MSGSRAFERDVAPVRRGILTAAELRRALREHPEWKIDGQQLVRELRFKDFERAFACVRRLAAEARDFQRHSDICLQDGNRVRVSIANPNHAGFTVGELRLAERVDAVLSEPPSARNDEQATRRRPGQRGRDQDARRTDRSRRPRASAVMFTRACEPNYARVRAEGGGSP